jgi:hypothetical protein
MVKAEARNWPLNKSTKSARARLGEAGAVVEVLCSDETRQRAHSRVLAATSQVIRSRAVDKSGNRSCMLDARSFTTILRMLV